MNEILRLALIEATISAPTFEGAAAAVPPCFSGCSLRRHSLREHRVGHPRDRLPAERRRDERRCVDDAVERDAGVDAEPVEQEQDVLGGDAVSYTHLRAHETPEHLV